MLRWLFIIEPPVRLADVYSPYEYSIKNKDTLLIGPHIFMPFSCETKHSDYSVSDSPQPDLKDIPI
jgi:hypothetical protein